MHKGPGEPHLGWRGGDSLLPEKSIKYSRSGSTFNHVKHGMSAFQLTDQDGSSSHNVM